MVKVKVLNGKPRISVSGIAQVTGLKPYVLKQLVQKLVHNRIIELPYTRHGEPWIDEASFIVVSERLGIGEGYHLRIIEAFNDNLP